MTTTKIMKELKFNLDLLKINGEYMWIKETPLKNAINSTMEDINEMYKISNITMISANATIEKVGDLYEVKYDITISFKNYNQSRMYKVVILNQNDLFKH